MKNILYSALQGLLFGIVAISYSQTALDSVILQRNNSLKTLQSLEENTEQRSWLKISDLNSRAMDIIDIDNSLINDFLFREIRQNNRLEDKIEKLNLEMALVKKETELQSRILDENKYLVKVLLISICALSIVFLVFLILFIDRQIRYRSIKLELERTWPIREEINTDSSLEHEVIKLNKQVGELNQKNSSLINEIEMLKNENEESQHILEKEKQSKKQFEEEIKKLILQIKT